MQPYETIYVEGRTAACDGGGGALGHPRVFLTLTADGTVTCPYCSRHYVEIAQKPGHAPAAGHAASGH